MGNYISVIIGCVGAVELITFLHQLTLSADQEHERELREGESADQQRTPGSFDEIAPRVLQEPPKEDPPEPSLVAVKKEEKEEIRQETDSKTVREEQKEELMVKVEAAAPQQRQGRPYGLPSLAPEIRFELYERSCSLSDVDRPLVDGLKLQRPLVRDDGSGRRKSIRKRNSSGSIDLKASREEELRMFTSLEEEEFSSLSEGGYVPISYGKPSGSSSHVVHPRRQRRFKRSPEQSKEELSASSHEVLDDVPLLEDPSDSSVTYPWGDIKPTKHRRHLGHEKSMSIEELQEDEERAEPSDEVTNSSSNAVAIENSGLEPRDEQVVAVAMNVADCAPSTVDESGCEQRQEEKGEGVSSGGDSGDHRIIVSIESEPNIERFARLVTMHDLMDEDHDADDDMTPMPKEDSNLPFGHQEAEIREEDKKEEETKETKEEVNVEDVGVKELESTSFTTFSQDIHQDQDVVIEDVIEFVRIEPKGTVKEMTEDFLESERTEEAFQVKAQEETEMVMQPEESSSNVLVVEYTVESPIQGRSIEIGEEEEEVKNDLEVSETLKKPMECIQIVHPEIRVTPPIEDQVMEEEQDLIQPEYIQEEIKEETKEESRENPSQFFIEHEIAVEKLSNPVITTEEPAKSSQVVEEDISNYENFVSIMQSDVVKETTKYFRFPKKPENKVGDFPKTVSELITFDDEDMTDTERKNLQLRKRQNSIKVKIQQENATMLKKTGHHRRYNMPAYSIDMTTRINLSNVALPDEKKVFPRKRQIFIPGNFPRDILHESEYKLKDKIETEPVRVQRITYTQPIVQLTMIREEPQKNEANPPIPQSPPTPPPPPVVVSSASKSVPASPDSLNPPTVHRSRSESPYIVDRDDPMMLLLQDTMEIPLVRNTEF